MVKYLFVALITAYQKTLSPDHGPLKGMHPHGFCRHSPTCSQYAKEQIMEKGALRGTFLTIKRVLRCNPWTEPDPKRVQEMLLR